MKTQEPHVFLTLSVKGFRIHSKSQKQLVSGRNTAVVWETKNPGSSPSSALTPWVLLDKSCPILWTQFSHLQSEGFDRMVPESILH